MDAAVALAERADADLHAVTVREEGTDGNGAEQAEDVLAGVTDSAAGASAYPIDAVVTSGTVHGAIVEYATDHRVDCVVTGTHGRTGVERVLLGSVAERVVRLAYVPVLTAGTAGTGE